MRGCYRTLRGARAVARPCSLAGAVPAATPRPTSEALAKFAADTFNDTDAGIAGVAASGNPLAAKVIEALQDGRLLFNAEDKKVYVRERVRQHCSTRRPARPSPAPRPPASSRCASTTACGAPSRRRSAA